ncbi:potassium channel family protein [Streptomyces sp. NPDC005402]|uniref:potassium channel family protein n=1 Tax=Streptomyces sp. NPDC005402 TaxID=3155338 RepID=UPI0033B30A05
MRSPNPRVKAVDALAAAVAPYLLPLAGTRCLLEQSAAASFSESPTRTDALYFTPTTFTAAGFGDVNARCETARMVTMPEVGRLMLLVVATRLLAYAVQTGLRRGGQVGPDDGGRETDGQP